MTKSASLLKISKLCSKEASNVQTLINESFADKIGFLPLDHDLDDIEVTDSTDSTSIDFSDVTISDNAQNEAKKNMLSVKNSTQQKNEKSSRDSSKIAEKQEMLKSEKKKKNSASKGLFSKYTNTKIISKTPNQTSKTKDAWMCCFCTANFASYQEANLHEQNCMYSIGEDALQNIVYYPKNISFGRTDKVDTVKHDVSERVSESDSNRLPPVILSSNVTLSDDTLRQALQSLSPNMLTLNEHDAERELSLMTRDKRYYDHMRKKRSEQTLDQSIRYVSY